MNADSRKASVTKGDNPDNCTPWTYRSPPFFMACLATWALKVLSRLLCIPSLVMRFFRGCPYIMEVIALFSR